jgi:hypothetical protein
MDRICLKTAEKKIFGLKGEGVTGRKNSLKKGSTICVAHQITGRSSSTG